MNCENCGSQTHGGYYDCMIVNGEFKGAWWVNDSKIDKLKFEIEHLKKIISFVHCSNCGNESRDTYKLIDNSVYCEGCHDYIIEKKKREKQEEIEKLEKRLKELRGE